MPRSLPAGVRGGAPPPGTPGGHIGDRITYAYCTDCGKEWTWNANGIPPSMESCGHPDDGIVIINYRAESHGMLVDNTAPDSSYTPAENPERQLQAVRASSDAPEGAGGRGAGPVAEPTEEREGRRPRFPDDDLRVDFGTKAPRSENPMPPEVRAAYERRILASVEAQDAGAQLARRLFVGDTPSQRQA